MNGTARQDQLQFIPIILAVHTKAKSIRAIFKALFLKVAVKKIILYARKESYQSNKTYLKTERWLAVPELVFPAVLILPAETNTNGEMQQQSNFQ